MWNRYYRWMYRGGRPNWWARPQMWLTNAMRWLGLYPDRLATLTVTARRGGRPVSLPLAVADYEGERYLVAMLGENTNWVRNVRASGGRAELRYGRRAEAVRLEETEVGVRAPILRRYLDRAPGARPHIPVDRRAPLADFERVAATYPVFRITTERNDGECRSGGQ